MEPRGLSQREEMYPSTDVYCHYSDIISQHQTSNLIANHLEGEETQIVLHWKQLRKLLTCYLPITDWILLMNMGVSVQTLYMQNHQQCK